MTLNKNNKYLALVEVLDNNQVKVEKAQKLVRVNQTKIRRWKNIPAREFARKLNTSSLVIK